MSLPLSTRILGGATTLLAVFYLVMLVYGDHNHGGGAAHQHHHHHHHEHVEYETILGAEPHQITFIEAIYLEGGWMLRLEDNMVILYEGAFGCYGTLPGQEPEQMAVRTDERLYSQWRTFFTNMKPDAHIDSDAIAESYGLDNPISCMRIGVLRDEGEEVVAIQFGELTVQGLNQYIAVNTSDDILLIPRYFWQQVRLQMP